MMTHNTTKGHEGRDGNTAWSRRTIKPRRNRTYTHNGLSMELARALGISDAYAGYILRGKRTPSLGMAHRMAKFLGISIDRLYERINQAREREQQTPRAA